ncbi:MAG: hypothetical protein PHC85_03125 [Candidatus Pacebacteria bacterium]|nr:hypothetical protein [Candidatus Paceibacterota bacterium]
MISANVLKYFRNKRLIGPVVFFLVLAGGFWLLSKEKSPSLPNSKTDIEKYADAAQNAMVDTDNDGLRDWEETLWKTSPNKTDTDDDGYSDFEETQNGFDPLSGESNEKTGTKGTNELFSYAENEKYKNINLTESLAEVMAGKIADPEGINSATAIENPFALLDEKTGVGLFVFVNSLRPKIAENELKITSDNSVESVKKYVSEVEAAIPENPYPRVAEEDIFTEVIESGNFIKIDKYISYYDTAIINMKNITIPSVFFENHKKQTELLMATQKVYEAIKETAKDPLKTVLALQENEKIRGEMKNLLVDFLNLVQKHGR